MSVRERPYTEKVRMDAKDFFVHLLTIIVFYICIISIISLLFQYINLAIPDPTNIEYPAAIIRWQLAMLVVMFPAFLYLSIYLHKEYEKFPEKKQLSIRKWLAYLTLFLTSLIVLCDFVTLLYYFLNGDLTTRFVLKVIAIFVVASAVLYYYSHDLKQNWKRGALRFFTILITTCVALIVIYGFIAVGSPFKQRMNRLDSERVSDLTVIQAQIINYWGKKNKLPASLGDLTDNISGFKAPLDPETKKPYDYKVLSDLSFELCANFFTKSAKESDKRAAPYIESLRGYPDEAWNWQHEIGRFCFTRNIDPQLYKKK